MKILNNINTILSDNFLMSNKDIVEFRETINFCFGNGIFFLRASKLNFTSKILKPSKKKRRSLSGTNLQEFLIDNNPYWKEFPKRSRSLMGVLEKSYNINELLDTAKTFTNFFGNNFYAIFPKNLNNKKIALSGSSDFIFSFPNINNIYDLYEVIITFFDTLHIIKDDIMPKKNFSTSYNFRNYEHFIECCKKAENYLYKYLNNYKDYKESDELKIFQRLMFNVNDNYVKTDDIALLNEILNKSLVNWLHEKLKPGIKSPKSNSVISDKNHLINARPIKEFWTEEDCLSVNLKVFDSFFYNIKKM